MAAHLKSNKLQLKLYLEKYFFCLFYRQMGAYSPPALLMIPQADFDLTMTVFHYYDEGRLYIQVGLQQLEE